MNKLPCKDATEEILLKNGCPKRVIEHSRVVRDFAVEIARKIVEKGFKIDLEIVEIGALLHDLGRVKSSSVLHGYYGGEMARALGFPETLVKIIERHVGAGIPIEEAVRLGLPNRSFMPETLEEKIVAYADNLIKHNKVMSFHEALQEFRRILGKNHPAVERLQKLHNEISFLAELEKKAHKQ